MVAFLDLPRNLSPSESTAHFRLYMRSGGSFPAEASEASCISTADNASIKDYIANITRLSAIVAMFAANESRAPLRMHTPNNNAKSNVSTSSTPSSIIQKECAG